ncbi:hypothetical protein BDY19DRAFT_993966 [Irpex rosettiformis]|uniref:Uncharacterized protein n=1 Tax=Irpex rosettiformis TaxID=378272 RepID=A0ACB8U2J0_9APHY|nr:hypothetical protein BDY19DRAFT_993966 [Irpex rosettiformis]
MSRLMFSDLEKEWLHRQLDSPEIQAILAANPSRILEADTAGNAVKVLRGRRNGDGHFKKAAIQITNLYLVTFNAPFTEETQLEFRARKKAMKNLGITFRHRRQAETNDQFQERISFEPLSKRIYNWLLSHSPNKVKKAPYARIAASSASSRRYTPYGVFKASGSSTTPSASDTAFSAPTNIGDWNKTLHSTKARQLESTVVNQLLDWTLQTGYMGFIILGGKNTLGEVRNFTVNNAATRDGMSFAQHMCNRFGITEQQWQTELDWFFQRIYNGGILLNNEATLDTVAGNPSSSNIVLTPPSSFAQEESTAEESPTAEDTTAKVASLLPEQCESSVESAIDSELHSGLDNVPLENSDTMLLDALLQHLVLPPFTGTSDVSASPATLPLPASVAEGEQIGSGEISSTTDSRTDMGGLEEQISNASKSQLPDLDKLVQKVNVVGCSSLSMDSIHDNTARQASEIGADKVTRSGRRIIPKINGTAAYDEVVLRQNAASRR